MDEDIPQGDTPGPLGRPSRPRRPAFRLLAASMVGLAEVFDPPKDENPPIEQAAPGQPKDDPVDLHLDPDHPERSVVVLRARPAAGS